MIQIRQLLSFIFVAKFFAHCQTHSTALPQESVKCNPQVDVFFVENPLDQRSFLQCKSYDSNDIGFWYRHSCPPNMIFEYATQQCRLDTQPQPNILRQDGDANGVDDGLIRIAILNGSCVDGEYCIGGTVCDAEKLRCLCPYGTLVDLETLSCIQRESKSQSESKHVGNSFGSYPNIAAQYGKAYGSYVGEIPMILPYTLPSMPSTVSYGTTVNQAPFNQYGTQNIQANLYGNKAAQVPQSMTSYGSNGRWGPIEVEAYGGDGTSIPVEVTAYNGQSVTKNTAPISNYAIPTDIQQQNGPTQPNQSDENRQNNKIAHPMPGGDTEQDKPAQQATFYKLSKTLESMANAADKDQQQQQFEKINANSELAMFRPDGKEQQYAQNISSESAIATAAKVLPNDYYRSLLEQLLRLQKTVAQHSQTTTSTTTAALTTTAEPLPNYMGHPIKIVGVGSKCDQNAVGVAAESKHSEILICGNASTCLNGICACAAPYIERDGRCVLSTTSLPMQPGLDEPCSSINSNCGQGSVCSVERGICTCPEGTERKHGWCVVIESKPAQTLPQTVSASQFRSSGNALKNVNEKCALNSDCAPGAYCSANTQPPTCQCLSTHVSVNNVCEQIIYPGQRGCRSDVQCAAANAQTICSAVGECLCPPGTVAVEQTCVNELFYPCHSNRNTFLSKDRYLTICFAPMPNDQANCFHANCKCAPTDANRNECNCEYNNGNAPCTNRTNNFSMLFCTPKLSDTVVSKHYDSTQDNSFNRSERNTVYDSVKDAIFVSHNYSSPYENNSSAGKGYKSPHNPLNNNDALYGSYSTAQIAHDTPFFNSQTAKQQTLSLQQQCQWESCVCEDYGKDEESLPTQNTVNEAKAAPPSGIDQIFLTLSMLKNADLARDATHQTSRDNTAEKQTNRQLSERADGSFASRIFANVSDGIDSDVLLCYPFPEQVDSLNSHQVLCEFKQSEIRRRKREISHEMENEKQPKRRKSKARRRGEKCVPGDVCLGGTSCVGGVCDCPSGYQFEAKKCKRIERKRKLKILHLQNSTQTNSYETTSKKGESIPSQIENIRRKAVVSTTVSAEPAILKSDNAPNATNQYAIQYSELSAKDFQFANNSDEKYFNNISANFQSQNNSNIDTNENMDFLSTLPSMDSTGNEPEMIESAVSQHLKSGPGQLCSVYTANQSPDRVVECVRGAECREGICACPAESTLFNDECLSFSRMRALGDHNAAFSALLDGIVPQMQNDALEMGGASVKLRVAGAQCALPFECPYRTECVRSVCRCKSPGETIVNGICRRAIHEVLPGGICDALKGLDCVGESHCFYGICVCLYGLINTGRECASRDVLKIALVGELCHERRKCAQGAACLDGVCQCDADAQFDPISGKCMRSKYLFRSHKKTPFDMTTAEYQSNSENANSQSTKTTNATPIDDNDAHANATYPQKRPPVPFGFVDENGNITRKFSQILTANQMSINVFDQDAVRAASALFFPNYALSSGYGAIRQDASAKTPWSDGTTLVGERCRGGKECVTGARCRRATCQCREDFSEWNGLCLKNVESYRQSVEDEFISKLAAAAVAQASVNKLNPPSLKNKMQCATPGSSCANGERCGANSICANGFCVCRPNYFLHDAQCKLVSVGMGERCVISEQCRNVGGVCWKEICINSEYQHHSKTADKRKNHRCPEKLANEVVTTDKFQPFPANMPQNLHILQPDISKQPQQAMPIAVEAQNPSITPFALLRVGANCLFAARAQESCGWSSVCRAESGVCECPLGMETHRGECVIARRARGAQCISSAHCAHGSAYCDNGYCICKAEYQLVNNYCLPPAKPVVDSAVNELLHYGYHTEHYAPNNVAANTSMNTVTKSPQTHNSNNNALQNSVTTATVVKQQNVELEKLQNLMIQLFGPHPQTTATPPPTSASNSMQFHQRRRVTTNSPHNQRSYFMVEDLNYLNTLNNNEYTTPSNYRNVDNTVNMFVSKPRSYGFPSKNLQPNFQVPSANLQTSQNSQSLWNQNFENKNVALQIKFSAPYEACGAPNLPRCVPNADCVGSQENAHVRLFGHSLCICRAGFVYASRACIALSTPNIKLIGIGGVCSYDNFNNINQFGGINENSIFPNTNSNTNVYLNYTPIEVCTDGSHCNTVVGACSCASKQTVVEGICITYALPGESCASDELCVENSVCGGMTAAVNNAHKSALTTNSQLRCVCLFGMEAIDGRCQLLRPNAPIALTENMGSANLHYLLPNYNSQVAGYLFGPADKFKQILTKQKNVANPSQPCGPQMPCTANAVCHPLEGVCHCESGHREVHQRCVRAELVRRPGDNCDATNFCDENSWCKSGKCQCLVGLASGNGICSTNIYAKNEAKSLRCESIFDCPLGSVCGNGHCLCNENKVLPRGILNGYNQISRTKRGEVRLEAQATNVYGNKAYHEANKTINIENGNQIDRRKRRKRRVDSFKCETNSDCPSVLHCLESTCVCLRFNDDEATPPMTLKRDEALAFDQFAKYGRMNSLRRAQARQYQRSDTVNHTDDRLLIIHSQQ